MKRTRNAPRALQHVLSMSAYPSCELGIGERRHVRYCALDEWESDIGKDELNLRAQAGEGMRRAVPIEFLE